VVTLALASWPRPYGLGIKAKILALSGLGCSLEAKIWPQPHKIGLGLGLCLNILAQLCFKAKILPLALP